MNLDTFLLIQAAPPQTAVDMILGGTLPTKIVLGVLAVFSLMSWWLIVHKWRQFRAVRVMGDLFLEKMERAQRLEDAYKAILSLPESPYSRVFRQGVNFFSELRPGALREGAPPSAGLSLTQLEALRLVLEKEEAEERDELARGLTRLAVIGSVSPLLGLMGTVIGVMNAFLGITAAGSTNIGAVAPGVAEALVTTVAGLAVAIPAVMAYNFFVGKLNLVTGELEGFSSEFIGTLAREGRV
ncbi:MAG: MotA/TolQ/ExbB proton channel family protein [Gemmatimonadota bacterium]|nr:MotA/TolQ/ExbB proton channel family protein [Gemmatimonadota bacterium]MDH5759774.1 MotA/TolQ/ExbB proton channel family protein [Gemmatimonadota bacterium]